MRTPEQKRSLLKLCFVVGLSIKNEKGRLTMSDYGMKLIEFPIRFFSEPMLLGPAVTENGSEPRTDILSIFPHLKIVPLPAPDNRLLRWIRQVPAIWRCVENADLVCVNIPEEASFLAALICRLQGKNLMVEVLGDWGRAVELNGKPGLLRNSKSAFANWMANTVVRSAQLVVTQGQNLFDKFSPQNPAAFKSSFVHSTLRQDVFFEEKQRPFHEPLRLLSVSRLMAGKGLELIPTAIHELHQRGVHAEWWCVGVGPLAPELAELASRTGIADSVRFTGFLSGAALWKVYREADIFVLPSYAEGVPNAMIEAMAQSLPLIVTAVGGIPYILENEIDSLLIGPGSSLEIVEAVMRLKKDPGLTDRIRANAFQESKKFLTYERSQDIQKMIEDTFGSIYPGSSSNPVSPETPVLQD